MKELNTDVLTVKEMVDKYADVESKIPSVWPTWAAVGDELDLDLAKARLWNVSDAELIRAIALIALHGGCNLNNHIDPLYVYAGRDCNPLK